jgi:hypothetical protein
MLPIRYTAHAETALAEREIDKVWVERTVRNPEWREPNPGGDQTVERRFRSVPERSSRFLRVVCVETREDIRILSAFLDRRARKPR